MPVYDLSGDGVFVTGAARGQGRSHAIRFAESGANVVVADIRSDESLVETVALVEEEGQSALTVETDFSDIRAVEGVVKQAVETFGTIDVLVNNSGIWEVATRLQLTRRCGVRSLM